MKVGDLVRVNRPVGKERNRHRDHRAAGLVRFSQHTLEDVCPCLATHSPLSY